MQGSHNNKGSVIVLWLSLLNENNADMLVHGQVTIILVFVCLCRVFFSAVFDPISIKLGHMLYVWV